MDKATEFRIKIASKNQLRQLLKHKQEVYNQIKDEPDVDFTKKQLHDEIEAIKLELETYE